MTTRLLAEVARRQQTTDFDDAAIDAMLETATEAEPESETEAAPEQIQQKETSHPHTLRRRMPSGTGR